MRAGPVSPTRGWGSGPIQSFGALPSAASPRLLVPLGAPRASSRAVRDYGNAGPLAVRIAKSVVSWALQIPGAEHLFPSSLHVYVEATGGNGAPHQSFVSHLQEVFDRPHIEIAIWIGGENRANRKPILQILTPSGEPLGYGKVGWNSLTRELVRNEAAVLGTFSTRPRSPAHFSVPRVLDFTEWQGLEILVVAPFHGSSGRTGPGAFGVPIEAPILATQEVGRLAPTQHVALAASRFWKRTRRRIAMVTRELPSGPGRPLRRIAEHLEDRFGEIEMTFASWHGDWSPANMTYIDGQLFVWDWERSDDVVPLGLDAVHFCFQMAAKFRRLPPATAVEQTLTRTRELLPVLRIPIGLEPLLLALELLEMSLRVEEARVAGISVRETLYRDALNYLIYRNPTVFRSVRHAPSRPG